MHTHPHGLRAATTALLAVLLLTLTIPVAAKPSTAQPHITVAFVVPPWAEPTTKYSYYVRAWDLDTGQVYCICAPVPHLYSIYIDLKPGIHRIAVIGYGLPLKVEPLYATVLVRGNAMWGGVVYLGTTLDPKQETWR